MFQPLNDNVLVRIETEFSTEEGILLPEIRDNIHEKGIVVAVGNGLRGADNKRVPIDVSVGDRIYFSKYATATVEYKDEGGETLYIVKEQDIHGILK